MVETQKWEKCQQRQEDDEEDDDDDETMKPSINVLIDNINKAAAQYTKDYSAARKPKPAKNDLKYLIPETEMTV